MSINRGQHRLASRSRLTLLMLLAAVMMGCAAAEPREHTATLTLSLDADAYQVGAPVRATVGLVNEGEAELLVPALDGDTLTFLLSSQTEGVPLKRYPVLPQDSLSVPRVVEPSGRVSRTFLFTRLTEKAGEWGLLASLSECRSGESGATCPPSYYSEPVIFQVTEDVLYERDPYSGLITREQAQALAMDHMGETDPGNVRVVLVPLEQSGLYVWTVLFGGQNTPVAEAPAVVVNPYSGVVKPLEFE